MRYLSAASHFSHYDKTATSTWPHARADPSQNLFCILWAAISWLSVDWEHRRGRSRLLGFIPCRIQPHATTHTVDCSHRRCLTEATTEARVHGHDS